MTPAPQHSDRSNTDNPESVAIRGPKWQPVFQIDERGYVCGPIRFRAPDAERSRQGYLELKRPSRYPFDRSEIVMPQPLWPMDADGRGLSVLEVKGAAFLREEQREIARMAREWADAQHHAIITSFAA
jgi:hypothetical protein